MAFDPKSVTFFKLGSEDYPMGEVSQIDDKSWQLSEVVLDDDGYWPGDYEISQLTGDLREVIQALSDQDIWIDSEATWEDFKVFMKPIWAQKKSFSGRFNLNIWEQYGQYVEYLGD